MRYRTGTILIILAISVFTMNFHCSGKGENHYFDPSFPAVKLSATLNDSAETIHLGDTLKFKLTIPDILTANAAIGPTQTITVNTLQRAAYDFHFCQWDPITNSLKYLFSNAVITDGVTHGYNSVYVSTNRKPYTATLNIIPPGKGIFYVQIGTQPLTLKVNNSFEAGLIVNFDVKNKHWELFEPYFPGFIAGAVQTDMIGYGWYCFKVD
jgi:hypothetical protein